MSVEWLRQTKLLMNQCCSLTSLTGCECAVCIDCNITASVARRRAAACMVMIWWSSVPSRTGPLSSLCLIVIHWCPHPHTATQSPEQRFLPASRHQSRPGSARRLGKPKWTEKLDPDCRHRVPLQISGAWHRAGTGTAVLCPLLPLAPGVYWKNVNYEFTCKLGGVPLIVNTRHYVTGCPKCPRSSVHRGMSQYARWYGHCTRNIFFNKCFFLPDVASHYSSPLPSDHL